MEVGDFEKEIYLVEVRAGNSIAMEKLLIQ